jgi:hypothetical protein
MTPVLSGLFDRPLSLTAADGRSPTDKGEGASGSLGGAPLGCGRGGSRASREIERWDEAPDCRDFGVAMSWDSDDNPGRIVGRLSV